MRILGILAVAVILAGFGTYFWLKSYLHSDEFRIFLGETVGEVLDADAEFDRFDWQGMNAKTASFSSNKGSPVDSIQAEGIRARLNLSGVRRKVWEISDVRVNRMLVKLDTRKDLDAENTEPETDTPPATSGGGGGGFLADLLPNRTEVKSAEISSLGFHLTTNGGEMKASNMGARLDAAQAEGAYDFNLAGGVVDTTWFRVPLNVQSARGKYQDGRIFINESKSRVYERGLLSLDGEIEGGTFGLHGNLNHVRAEELVPSGWKKRITGDLQTEFVVHSGEKHVVTRGRMELENGILTALPMLDRIAAYANTRRFRRLQLSEAKLAYRKEGDRLELTEIVMASEGLVRITGSLTVDSGKLDGRFRVGITPGTLAHIPGAETKVFLRGDRGLLWSPLRITGTVDAPKEDLSDRMIAAAGERMFELVPETGKMALKFAHETLTELPSKALDTGAGILGEGAGAGGDIIEGGTEILREGVGGVLDLIPGSSSREKDDEDE